MKIPLLSDLIQSLQHPDASHFRQSCASTLAQSLPWVELDSTGNILKANPRFLQMLAYPEEALTDQPFLKLLEPNYANSSPVREIWAAVMAGEAVSIELPCQGNHGDKIWILATACPSFAQDGALMSIVLSVTDITAHKNNSQNNAGYLSAINRSQAVIEFDLKGHILHANDNFLAVMGYRKEEIIGKHHSMFLDTATRQTPEYKQFWSNLAAGEYQQGVFKRIAKNGNTVWISASYNPVLDDQGKPVKVVKFASDLTERLANEAYMSGQIAAIQKSQAVIEFDLQGNILTANDNFLNTLGYSLDEIKGRHHAMFVPSDVKHSDEYKRFWESLRDGVFQAGDFHRISKSGEDIWIHASYNPIFDAEGKPFKVVKYASDITVQKAKNANYEGQIAAINKTQAVIEFTLEGNIVHANENFLSVMGYSLGEIKGRHHAIFVDPDYRRSSEYSKFWDKLRRGESHSGEFKRFAKDGFEVWIQAAYTPITDATGRLVKVVKYATDITAKKQAVEKISASLLSLAEGDLNHRITDALDSEFEPVRSALNATIDRLSELITEINRTSLAVSTAAKEIHLGTNDLSSRTESQASSLEQTAASLQEITSTVNQNAKTAKQAVTSASVSTQKAEQGGLVVQEAVQAMAEIETSSKQISDIIGVINEIAFQTNLLALNAAVEAARAGEQGRGFAVVAGEVRNLAQRSAKASIEIKELINSSVNKVKDGTALVHRSGDDLISIVAAIKEVSNLITNISQATQEQSRGISEINRAVNEMDNMTQQNAGLAEETTAASQNLFQEAENLRQLVSFFNVDEGK